MLINLLTAASHCCAKQTPPSHPPCAQAQDTQAHRHTWSAAASSPAAWSFTHAVLQRSWPCQQPPLSTANNSRLAQLSASALNTAAWLLLLRVVVLVMQLQQ